MAKKANEYAKDQRFNPGKPISKGHRAIIMDLVIDEYLKGRSYRWIGKEVGRIYGREISPTTVGKYINGTLADWKSERIEKLDDLKTVELQRISKLELTYWDAWERSKEGTKRTSERQKAAPGKAINKDGEMEESMNVSEAHKSIDTHETYGDPRFLDGIKWCIAMRCKILGIEAPIEFKGSMTSEIKRTTVFKTRNRKRPI